MRITTKVIQNNSLSSINTNKLLQDKLSQQMSLEKKVTRPSDDPIVAIRALRLRTNVNQVTQYASKNVPDAESWLEVTESGLSALSDVITDMIEQCNKGSNEKLTTSDRNNILEALKALRDEVYSTGNADYAGRYIFTGYRTDTPLTFGTGSNTTYSITEQVDSTKIDTYTYVNTSKLLSVDETNYAGNTMIEQDIKATEVHRLRLSYDDIDDTVPKIQVWDDTANNGNGGMVDLTANYKTVSLYDSDNPYEEISKDADGVYLVKETGELLLGDNVYKELLGRTDKGSTTVNEGEIRIVYEKSRWESSDLRPEHYFACETKVNGQTQISYNQEYLTPGYSDEDKQAIKYDVGMNQSIRVNTTADEVFVHDISRDVDDIVRTMENAVAVEKQLAYFQELLEKNPNDTELNAQVNALSKASVLLNEETQKKFEGGITKMQKHLDTVNYAVTENGTRGQKLDLISNRLTTQKTNFETLKSENEDIDITEVAIKLSSAQLTYSSALMATGKVLQNSLMNFI